MSKQRSTGPGTSVQGASPGAAGSLTDDDLSVFFDLSTELFGVFEPRGSLVWCNSSVERILGYQPGELGNVDLSQLVHPDDLGSPTEDLEDFPRDGSMLTLEVRCRAKDGAWHWIEWSGSWDPVASMLYGAARDVTERHVVGDALARSEALIQAILDHADAAVHVEDLDERCVLVNESFLRMVGTPREETLGKRASEVWAPRTDPSAPWRAAVHEDGRTVTTDEVIELEDGAHTFMTTRFPVADDRGAVIGMAVIATDISNRTAAEKQLDESQKLLGTIVSASPDIVTVVDRNGRVTEVSEASSRILGHDLAHPDHEELEALVHPDDLPAVYEAYGDLLAQRVPQLDLRYRARHRDGHFVALDTRGKTIVDSQGRVQGAVVVSRDMTNELAFEEQLQAALAEAELASSAKSQFLSRMSHELRTPLNSIMGFAQLLGMEDLVEQQHEAVGHILRAGHHLLNLIDEVLDISRIESGRLDVTLRPVEMAEVVADAVDLVRLLAEDRGIAVEVDMVRCPAGTYVEADRQRLLQVLLNLLSNGVKYNQPDGTVTVSVVLEGEQVRMEVTDTGPGIAAEDADRLFKPFDRLGAERSGVQGTGVGLTLSKHLVEQMGGSLTLGTGRGPGATFVVALHTTPAPVTGHRRAPAETNLSSSGAGALRVLHIEDNLANLELVEQILHRAAPLELRAAMSGGLGLELARELHPDLVLLDVNLPDMPGSEVLARLRADPATSEVRVVVVSADATPSRVRALEAEGVVAYLTKPIDIQELLGVVELVRAQKSAGPDGEESGGQR